MSLARGPGGLSLRPLVVRFTDPMMEDAHMDLIYERVDDEVERRWPRLVELTVGQVKERVRDEALTHTRLWLPILRLPENAYD